MASKSLAIFFILLLGGHEVLAMRQRVKQRAGAEAASDIVDMVSAAMNKTDVDSNSQKASCDKDIIVETSDGKKKVVLASDYKNSPFEVLKKYNGKELTASYHVACKDGDALVKVTSSKGLVSERKFSWWHWWRDTEIKRKGETIAFSDDFPWESMSSGKVTFTPSGASCEEDQEELEQYGAEIVSMLKEHRVRNFHKVSANLRGYANKEKEMKAMGCPKDLMTVDTNIVDAMEEYFTENQGGRESPMASARFAAALEKARSTSSPSKGDFVELVTLIKYGSCPDFKEANRSSPNVADQLPDDVDDSEDEDEDLEASVQACFAEEECGDLASKVRNKAPTSLLQEEQLAVTEANVVGFLANFLVFLSIFILATVFWSFAFAFALMLSWLLVMILLTPIILLAGEIIDFEEVKYRLGKYDYLVDEFCRPFIHESGLPVRQMSDGLPAPAQLAPPVQKYIVYQQHPVYDSLNGWPIGIMVDGKVQPIVGLPQPASDEKNEKE